MAELLPREHFSAGTVVCEADTPGTSAYVIEAGCVEVLAPSPAPVRRLAILGPGALFGEVALLDGNPRTATVKTVVDTTLIRIDRQHVDELLHRADPVIQYLLKLLLERFRTSQDSLGCLSTLVGMQLPSGPVADLDVQEAALRTLTLARDLSHAIETDQLELHYQPLCSCHDRSLLGYEALVRWRHPTLGLIMPLEFINLAEKTGLIRQIGRWVVAHAIADWPELRRHCQRHDGLLPFVSVNLSAGELGDPGIVDFVRDHLQAAQMSAQELKIELTETVIIEDREAVAAVLERLAAQGNTIVLDDFGTGYAGLEYLKALPISCLKIDKNFVQDMATSLPAFEIVKAALNLAWSLGFTTVAEGIEDEATLQRLDEMGCDIAQGYLISRPLPLAAIPEWAASLERQP